ncbi:hypothetical protein [Cohnella nanjingensis]|uniref:Uncharacterized protein n=1 Tax=Cohnella nanjingensis TaxID=1387779 RepID=A0A7X0RL10_9BACL|nr:hypothetical protein [Cohnella nanjingensis]MBB6669395.1 hypothetical protein [Cohnella nanjingensis]
MIDMSKRWAKYSHIYATMKKRFLAWAKQWLGLKDATEPPGSLTQLHESRPISYQANSDVNIDLSSTSFSPFGIIRIIATSLPYDYEIPNPESLRVILPMTADHYRSLFSVPTSQPNMLVDDQVWLRIKAALPKGYLLPGSEFPVNKK